MNVSRRDIRAAAPHFPCASTDVRCAGPRCHNRKGRPFVGTTGVKHRLTPHSIVTL